MDLITGKMNLIWSQENLIWSQEKNFQNRNGQNVKSKRKNIHMPRAACD